jgi:hypothetical protein
MWRDKVFVWWTELDDPPTSRQLHFWERIRERGRLRYLVAGSIQITVIILILAILMGFILAGPAMFQVLTPISGMVILLPLLKFVPEFYLRWNKNEQIFLDHSARTS